MASTLTPISSSLAVKRIDASTQTCGQDLQVTEAVMKIALQDPILQKTAALHVVEELHKIISVVVYVWEVGDSYPHFAFQDVKSPSELPLRDIEMVDYYVEKEDCIVLYWGTISNWEVSTFEVGKVPIDDGTRAIFVRIGRPRGVCKGLGEKLYAMDIANASRMQQPLADFRWAKNPSKGGRVPVFIWPKEDGERPIAFHLPSLKNRTFEWVLNWLRDEGGYDALREGWMVWNARSSRWQVHNVTDTILFESEKTLLLRHAQNKCALYAGLFIMEIEDCKCVKTGHGDEFSLGVGDGAHQEDASRKRQRNTNRENAKRIKLE
ncbi:uncharacterized protein BXZ73DRAFT_107683 [Epithele typhae]|uniref:uncharacterized protein n=1 Tax=Epithele typhae TaxID=378194 RepID=UPI002007578C|nr:uncharacterized protein BXZ73DRAFT_107683 [Epithele typhae]KAH9912050.1 hypothetical protein BXZ73DRAFT_107683 [Epithele typhae]